MKRTTPLLNLSALALISLSATLSGCPDPAPVKPIEEGGTEGGSITVTPPDMGPESDMEPVIGGEMSDMGPVEADMEPILDMEPLPDMEVVDMEPPPPPLYEGAACVEDTECAPNERCAFGVCRFDLRPTVYRMSSGEVFEPVGGTGQLLEVLLNNSVQSEMLNLMFEPGFYTEEGQAYWFIGNGFPDTEGYVYRRNFPIQNFMGAWLNMPQEDGTAQPEWHLEGQRPFILAVPTGVVTPADTETYGETFQCTTTFPTTVNVIIKPLRNEGEDSYTRILVETNGYLKRSDIEQIRILFNGNEINFIDYFNNVELLDLNGDGDAQEYAFHLEVEATPINFLEELARPDRLDLRDPSPAIAQPPECEAP